MTAVSTTPVEVQKPLSDFQKIGHNTYVWTSSSYNTKSPLILLFTWNAAAAKHIAKYTASYQRLFPTARIVLIRNFLTDIFRANETYKKLLTPGIEIVREHTQSGGKTLVHSFSNGGANQVNEFAKAWVERYGELLPMRAQVLDSGPADGGWIRTHNAIMAALPKAMLWRLIGSALVHAILFAVFSTDKLMRRENMILVICREINDGRIFDKSVPRVYLYSRADEMLAYNEIEKQAEDAEAKGWSVKKVRFEDSAHAGHIREDEVKYWGAVMEAWKAGPKAD